MPEVPILVVARVLAWVVLVLVERVAWVLVLLLLALLLLLLLVGDVRVVGVVRGRGQISAPVGIGSCRPAQCCVVYVDWCMRGG